MVCPPVPGLRPVEFDKSRQQGNTGACGRKWREETLHGSLRREEESSSSRRPLLVAVKRPSPRRGMSRGSQMQNHVESTRDRRGSRASDSCADTAPDHGESARTERKLAGHLAVSTRTDHGDRRRDGSSNQPWSPAQRSEIKPSCKCNHIPHPPPWTCYLLLVDCASHSSIQTPHPSALALCMPHGHVAFCSLAVQCAVCTGSPPPRKLSEKAK